MLIGKNGLNPTIPVCPYCGKSKNMIVLTGLAGERWAEKNGFHNGEMPKNVQIDGDFEPCDECKKNGIAIVEVVSDCERKPTGNRWLVKEDFIKRLFSQNIVTDVLKRRVVMIPTEIAELIGLHRFI